MDRTGRWVLIAAAALLLLAGGYRLGRGRETASATAAATTPQPAAPDPLPALEATTRAPTAGEGDWRALGTAYFDHGRFADAARAFARAAALAPRSVEAWSSLGEALVSRDRQVSDDADRAFRRAIAIDPKDARARYFLAVRQDVGGDHRGAVEAWIALLHDAPPDAPWAASVRSLVEQVAARNKIDIAGRLPPAPPSSSVAADAIPGPDAGQLRDAARLPPGEQDAMAKAMVDKLAARLAADPRDAAGWMRLMRARLVLGDAGGARQALVDGRKAFAGDTATLAQLDEAARTLDVPR